MERAATSMNGRVLTDAEVNSPAAPDVPVSPWEAIVHTTVTIRNGGNVLDGWSQHRVCRLADGTRDVRAMYPQSDAITSSDGAVQLLDVAGHIRVMLAPDDAP